MENLKLCDSDYRFMMKHCIDHLHYLTLQSFNMFINHFLNSLSLLL